MRWPFAKSTWEKAMKANVALSFAVAVSVATAAFVVVNEETKHERIVLTPLVVDKTMSVGWESADEEYLKAIALSVALLVGNLTPDNVTFVVDALSLLMDSSIYPDLRKKILSVVATRQFRELAASTRFQANGGITYESETGKLYVTGVTELLTATGKEKTPMTYEMTIKIKKGRPVIFQFDNYADQPHTVTWHATHAPEKEVPK